jgi:hypothetical protein
VYRDSLIFFVPNKREPLCSRFFSTSMSVSFFSLPLTGLNREHIGCGDCVTDVSLLGTGLPWSCNLLHDLNSNLEFYSRTYLLNLYVLTECNHVYQDSPIFSRYVRFTFLLNLYVSFLFFTPARLNRDTSIVGSASDVSLLGIGPSRTLLFFFVLVFLASQRGYPSERDFLTSQLDFNRSKLEGSVSPCGK